MAKHEEFANEEFAKDKLNALQEPEGFSPSASRGRMHLEMLQGRESRRWVWKVAFAAVPLALFLAMPAARAVAQTGTLSPDAYLDALHGSLMHVHYVLYMLWQHL